MLNPAGDRGCTSNLPVGDATERNLVMVIAAFVPQEVPACMLFQVACARQRMSLGWH